MLQRAPALLQSGPPACTRGGTGVGRLQLFASFSQNAEVLLALASPHNRLLLPSAQVACILAPPACASPPATYVPTLTCSDRLRPGKLLKFVIGPGGISFRDGQPVGAPLSARRGPCLQPLPPKARPQSVELKGSARQACPSSRSASPHINHAACTGRACPRQTQPLLSLSPAVGQCTAPPLALFLPLPLAGGC